MGLRISNDTHERSHKNLAKSKYIIKMRGYMCVCVCVCVEKGSGDGVRSGENGWHIVI